MSYDVFIQIDPPVARANVQECLLAIRGAHINGTWGIAISPTPDVFVTIDLKDDPADSATLSFAYGGSPEEPNVLLEVAAILAAAYSCSIFDPQVGSEVSIQGLQSALCSWNRTNLQVLQRYADGFHFVRDLNETTNGRIMLEAQRVGDRSPENYCSVACAFGRAGHYRDARRLLKKAHSEFENHVPTMYLLGITYLNLGKTRRALRLLKKAQQFEPENQDIQELIQSMNQED